ncbi:MAG: hypothetical protein ACREIF_19585 [Chthoniobacterales bacterium]
MVTRFLPLFVVVAAVLLGSCDTMNVQQYRIAPANGSDRAKVKRVLHSIASELALADHTSSSHAPNTLVFYMQPDVQHFAVELGAREVGSDIVIDLSAGFGPRSPEYVRAEQLLGAGLAREFDSRARHVEHPDTMHTASQ